MGRGRLRTMGGWPGGRPPAGTLWAPQPPPPESALPVSLVHSHGAVGPGEQVRSSPGPRRLIQAPGAHPGQGLVRPPSPPHTRGGRCVCANGTPQRHACTRGHTHARPTPRPRPSTAGSEHSSWQTAKATAHAKGQGRTRTLRGARTHSAGGARRGPDDLAATANASPPHSPGLSGPRSGSRNKTKGRLRVRPPAPHPCPPPPHPPPQPAAQRCSPRPGRTSSPAPPLPAPAPCPRPALRPPAVSWEDVTARSPAPSPPAGPPLTKWCINPFPPWDVMTLRSGLRLGAPSWALWVGGGGDLAGTTLFKLLPLATGSRPGEARALT